MAVVAVPCLVKQSITVNIGWGTLSLQGSPDLLVFKQYLQPGEAYQLVDYTLEKERGDRRGEERGEGGGKKRNNIILSTYITYI